MEKNVLVCFFFLSKILGFLIAAIGIYAWIEKDTFDNFGRLTMGGTLFFDPALLFVLVGIFMFFIGFAGCVGSLRENTCLLFFVCYCQYITSLNLCCFLVQFRFSDHIRCSACLWYTGIHLSRKSKKWRWKTVNDHDTKLPWRSWFTKYDRLDSTLLVTLLWCE